MHLCIYQTSSGRTPSSNGVQALKRTDLQPRKRRNKKKKRNPIQERGFSSPEQSRTQIPSSCSIAVSYNTKWHGFMRFATATEISDEKIEEKGRGIERLLARAQQPCEESALQSNRREGRSVTPSIDADQNKQDRRGIVGAMTRT